MTVDPKKLLKNSGDNGVRFSTEPTKPFVENASVIRVLALTEATVTVTKHRYTG